MNKLSLLGAILFFILCVTIVAGGFIWLQHISQAK